MSRLNWSIFTGAEFESLVHSVLFFDEPDVILFGRPGADSGQDAITKQKTHVYQAKYGKNLTFPEAIKRAKVELKKIRKYKNEKHPNYPFWKPVTHWTLVCNATINPQDQAKWEQEVIEEFSDLGMELDYWDATSLENKLFRLEDVKNAYFDGKNRCFLGIWEARKYLENGFLGEYFFKSEHLNQSHAFEDLEAFLSDANKKVLIVGGDPGSGKTRFIYECAVIISGRMPPFWGLSASMTASSSWFSGLSQFDNGACLIVDNVSSPLLAQIYDQLSVAGRLKWKAIVVPNNDSMKLFTNEYAKRRDTSCTLLASLETDDVRRYMEAFGCQPKQIKQSSIEERVRDLSNGNPLLLCVMLAGNSSHVGGQFSLAPEVSDFVQSYIQKALLGNNRDAKLVERSRRILRWLSIYKTIFISSEGTSLAFQEFLCRMTQSTLDELRDSLNILVDSRLIVRWGNINTRYTVASDLVRNATLSQWLLEKRGEKFCLNQEGLSFVSNLLHENIMYEDNALKNLAIFTQMYLQKDEQHKFFSALFDEIEQRCLRKSILECKRSIKLLGRVAYLNPEEALFVLKKIWNHAATCDPEKVETWYGKTSYSFQNFLPEIREVLFSIAYSADCMTCFVKVWKTIKEYQKVVCNPQIDTECKLLYNQVSSLLGDITIGACYREQAYKEINFDDTSYPHFQLIILASLLSPKQKNSSFYKRTITMRSKHIIPNTEDWEIATTLRKKLFQKIQEGGFEENCELECLNLLIESHAEWRDFNFHNYVGIDAFKDDIIRVVLDDLNKTLDILNSKTTREKTRLQIRAMWENALEFPISDDEKELAAQCEAAFNTYLNWDFARLFSWNEKDNAEELINEIVESFRKAETENEIRQFFVDATNYLELRKPHGPNTDFGRCGLLLEASFSLYSLNGETAFCRYINSEMKNAKGYGTFKGDFLVFFLRQWLCFFKKEYPGKSVADEFKRLLGDSSVQGDLLHAVYAHKSPCALGGATLDEFEYICARKTYFTDEQFVQILPFFLSVNEEKIRKLALSCFENNRDNYAKLNHLWIIFAEALYYIVRTEEETNPPNPVNWLMDSFRDFNINGAYLREYELKRLAKLGEFKFSQSDFVALIEQRLCLEKYEGDGRFEILPHDLDLANWVTTKEDPAALETLCGLIFEGKTYFTGHCLPKFLPRLATDISPIITFVTKTLARGTLSLEELYQLGVLASHYSDLTKEWEQIVVPICEYMTEMGIEKHERLMIISSFQSGDKSYVFNIGEIPEEVTQRMEAVKALCEKRTYDKSLAEYWEWAYANAKHELDQFTDNAEASKYE